MYPINGIPMNPMIPLFEGVKRTAANIAAPGERGEYTLDMFSTDFPEFFRAEIEPCTGQKAYTPLLPETIVSKYIESANNAVIPSRWGSDWEMAAGLYVAHFCALRLQTYADGSASPAAVAANAGNVGTVKTATLGDTSLSYDNSAINSGTEKWGTWNLTKYGSQLATMARMIGIAGMYAI